MKILITGGSGFIAKNSLQQLDKKYTILALDSKELNLLDSSKVFNFIKSKKFDAIIHTATYDAVPKHSTKDPAKVLEYNLKMFFNLARCKDYFGKMIYFGSGAEFGRKYWIPKMKEDYFDKYVPEDQYGFSKYIMAKYAQSSSNIFNLRLFGVFGKYDDYRTRLTSNACYLAAKNLPINIVQNKYYDFLYINDLVKIVDWFINNKQNQNIYNVCTGKVIDFKTIAEKIIKISGKKLEFKIEKKGLGKEYSGDNSLLLKEIKNLNFMPLEKAIKDLYFWYENHKQEIK